MIFARKATVAAVVVAFVCSISFGASGAWGDSGGTFVQGNVHGTAVDGFGKPLGAGQLVEVYDANGKLVASVYTNSSGVFDLSSLGVGSYNMAIGGVTAPLNIVAATAGAATAFTVVVTGTHVAGAGVAGLTLLKWGGVGLAVVAAAAVTYDSIKKKGASD